MRRSTKIVLVITADWDAIAARRVQEPEKDIEANRIAASRETLKSRMRWRLLYVLSLARHCL
jgi:hypothetical protein